MLLWLLKLLLTAGLLFTASNAEAGILKTVSKGVHHLAGKVLGESAEAAGRKATRLAFKQSDDVARLALRHSDDAAKLAVRFGDESVDVARMVSPQSSRRLAMIADELNATGQAPEVLQLIKTGGKADQVVDFLYRHKGAITGGTVLATLIANPEAALATASDITLGLADTMGSHIAQPMIENSMRQVIGPVVSSALQVVMWGVFAAIVTVVVVRRNTLMQDLKILMGLQKHLAKRVTWKWLRKPGG